MTLTAPIRLVSEANQREHWAAKHRRKKQQQWDMAMHWRAARMKPQLPCHVVITRIGPRKLDTDNLASACKHVQDAIARELKVDDGDASKVTWEYQQEPGPYGVRVTVIPDL